MEYRVFEDPAGTATVFIFACIGSQKRIDVIDGQIVIIEQILSVEVFRHAWGPPLPQRPATDLFAGIDLSIPGIMS